jgi:2'-5' RNA ligase
LFVATSIQQNVKKSLKEVQTDLKKVFGNKGATFENSMHLTLKFLGNTNENLIPDIENSLQLAVEGFSTITLSLTEINCFPNCNFPKIVFGKIEPVSEISKLANSIDKQMQQLGFDKNKKPFQPHITIFRPKVIKKINPKKYNIFEKLTINSVKLYESVLKPDRAYYSVIKEIKIKEKQRGSK